MSRKMLVAISAMAFATLLGVAAGCAAPTGPVANVTNQQTKQKTQAQEATLNAAIDKAQSVVTSVAAKVGTLQAKNKGQQVNAKLEQLQKQLTQALHETGSAKTNAVNNASKSFTEAIASIESAAKSQPAGSARQVALNDLAAKLKTAQSELAAAVAGAK